MKENQCQQENKKMLWLPQLRESLGLTITQLASVLGIEANTLLKYESGMRNARFSVQQILILKGLLNELGCDISDLPPDGKGKIKKLINREKIAA